MIDIFVPVYNEGKNIEALLDEIQQKVKIEFEVIIVYDSEDDDTLPVLRKIKNKYAFNIRVEKNMFGKGALNAFKTGMKKIQHEYLVFTMADLSDSLETINAMYGKMNEGYDMVAGSRYMKGGATYGGPLLKKMFSKCAGLGMHTLIGIPLHDITNGFKMYSKEVIESIPLESTAGFEVNLELTLKTYLEGYNITEVPATWKDREVGESNFKMWKWIPKYLYWCFYAIRIKWFDRGRKKDKKGKEYIKRR